jgi:hypothetical protein
MIRPTLAPASATVSLLLLAATAHGQEAASDSGASAEGGFAAQLDMEGENETSASGDAAAPAAAAVVGFGAAGTFAIGAERLFGFAQTSYKAEVDDTVPTEVESKNTSAYLFTNGAGGQLGGPFVAPRIGLDYFVIDRLSVGLALGYANDSGETERTQNGNAQGETEISTTAYLLNPRVGYAVMFSPNAGIWPRLGVSYAKVTQNVADTETSTGIFAITGELLLVLSPFEHVGFTIGPTVDFGLFGSADVNVGGGGGGPTYRDADSVKLTTLGLQVGILTWF